MKKIIFSIMVVVIMVSIVSCNSSNDSKYLQYIYEIEGTYDTNIGNHTNIISYKPQYTVDNDVVQSKTINVINNSYDFNYKESLYYPIGDKKVYDYRLDKDGEKYVILNEDGSVYAFLFDFITIDVSPTDSSDEVRTELEKVITEWIDISEYQHVRVDVTGREGDFGIYSYYYYNMVNNILTNYATVSVGNDGGVSALWIIDIEVDEEDINNIDKELEEQMIQLKLEDVYNTETTSYISHEQLPGFMPQAVEYNGELCIEYTFGVRFLNKEVDEERNIASNILIPVRLISVQE